MYTINKPKSVKHFLDPEEENFTGVVKDKWRDIAYYVNGEIHREDGPAVIYPSGAVRYYLNGECHREEGPAIIYPDSSKEYWLNHKRLPMVTDQELKDYLILRMLE